MELFGIPIVIDENLPEGIALMADCEPIVKALAEDNLSVSDLKKMQPSEAAGYIKHYASVLRFHSPALDDC